MAKKTSSDYKTCPFCEKNPVASRNRLCMCWSCYDRRKRARHPASYWLRNLRVSAARRGWRVLIDIDAFTRWCRQWDYFTLHEMYGCVIGRVNHAEDYYYENMIPMSPELNARLGHYVPPDDFDRSRLQSLLAFKPGQSAEAVMQQLIDETNCPF